MNGTTPQAISAEIAAFCASISREAAQFVAVQPTEWAKFGRCFGNASVMALSGGTVETGWIIWEVPGVFIEAEHHAIWRDPAGTLIDITPKPDGETTVLFLPDRNACLVKGEPRLNKRRALTDSPVVKDFLHTMFAADKLRLKARHRRLTKSESKRMDRLAMKSLHLLMSLQ